MILIHSSLNLRLSLVENTITELVVENAKTFSTLLYDLYSQANNGIGGWLLSEHEEEYAISKKTEVIFNPFNVDINDKRFVKFLYQELKENIMDEYYDRFVTLNSQNVSFLDELTSEQPYFLDIDVSISPEDLFKMYNIRFVKEEAPLINQLIDYIKICHKTVRKDIYIFVNIKDFLTEEELAQLYEFVLYEKIYIILFEAQKRSNLEHEKTIIVDKDLCIIDLSDDNNAFHTSI